MNLTDWIFPFASRHLDVPNGTDSESEEQLFHAMNALALLQYPFYFRIGTQITASGDLMDRLSGVNLAEFMWEASENIIM